VLATERGAPTGDGLALRAALAPPAKVVPERPVSVGEPVRSAQAGGATAEQIEQIQRAIEARGAAGVRAWPPRRM
jgi:hypothetical protein